MRKSIIICFLFIIGLSCDPPAEETTTITDPETQELTDEEITVHEPLIIDQPNVEPDEVILEADASEWLVYEGTIPCADCKGINMRLKLENRSGADDKAYELTETYIGTKEGDRNYQSRGVYQITYGHGNDPSAILITLVDKNNAQRVFMQDESENLKLLDKDGKKIRNENNYTLSKL